MRYPIITGDGRVLDPDTDDYQRLKLLPEACEGIDPRLWEMFAEPQEEPAESWMMTSKP